MVISVIDPIGGKVGQDDYNFGYMQELSLRGNNILYFSNLITKNRGLNRIKQIPSFGEIWKTKSRIKNFFYLIKGQILSVIISKKNKVDLIHLHFYNINLISLLNLIICKLFAKIPIIITLHDVNCFRRNNSKLIEFLSFNLIDGVILHNNFSKKIFKKRINFRKNIFVIPQGNYINQVPKLKNKVIKNKNKLNILFFGQIKKVKGIDILIKALKILNEKNFSYSLTIAGMPWDISKEYLLDRIKKEKLSKQVNLILKFIDDDLKNKLYDKCDLVVLPYEKIYNSAVLMLTASMNRAVLVSNLEPLTDIVEHNKNGLIFKNNDPKDLANKIYGVEYKNLNFLSNNLYNKIKNKFSWKKVANELVIAYQKTI